MKRNLYCLYDKLACEAGIIFEAQSDTHAQRMKDACKEWPAGSGPDDFEIIKLGVYFHGDEQTPPYIEAV